MCITAQFGKTHMLLDRRAPQAPRALRALPAPRALPALLAIRAPRAPRAHKVIPVWLDRRAPQEVQALLEPRARRGPLVRLQLLRDRRAPQEPLERQAQQPIPALVLRFLLELSLIHI